MQLLGYRRSIIRININDDGVLHFETGGKFGWCVCVCDVCVNRKYVCILKKEKKSRVYCGV